MIEYQAAVIENVCAWPNLTALPDGTIAATIFNQPAHGSLPGDVDCWTTGDQGKTWQKRGTAAPRPLANANRMNVTAGLATNGDFIVIASGYGRIGEQVSAAERVLPAVVCRSADGGDTWTTSDEFPMAPEGRTFIPFGDIMAGADGALRVTCYTAWDLWATYMLRSDDNGYTWGSPVKIGEGLNECAPLHLGEGRWLAAIRTTAGRDLRLFASDDDGATWTDRGPVTKADEHPAHLLRLRDGRILLSYGNRNAGQTGVEALLSADEGSTWSAPLRLIELPKVDLGYPGSVQLPDGKVLTAYYARQGPGCDNYHMGVVIWSVPEAD